MDGERPYVDFVTPIQAGFLWFNYQVETWTGGNYYGLTLGALPSLVGGFALLGYTHSRRWPWWWSLLAAWTVLMGSVGQHTIIWHNSLGVLCLAVALWVTTLWAGRQSTELALVSALRRRSRDQRGHLNPHTGYHYHAATGATL